MTDIRQILGEIRPGAIYGWKGGAWDDPEQVDWRDEIKIEPTPEEYAAGWIRVQDSIAEQLIKDNRRDSAQGDFDSTPLSALTATQAEDWIDANVTDLAGVIQVLKFIIRMIIALRNDRWP